MRINDENMIELAVNELFDYKGTVMRVIEDSNPDLICKGVCDFYHTHACWKFECRSKKREDETSVHFITASKRRII